MNAVEIGPVIFSHDRFAAILALIVLIICSEVMTRKVDSRFSAWAWSTVFVFVLAARFGHVVQHSQSFLETPWRAVAIWQGGFRVDVGILAAIAYTVFRFRHDGTNLLWSLLPGTLAGFSGGFVLWVALSIPQVALPSGSTYRTLYGTPFQPDELLGRPVVINLWATWCPPCRREMPMMLEVADQSETADIIFINQGEQADIIQGYLTSNGLESDDIITDPLGEFGRHYASRGFPTTLFLNSNGILQSVHVREISKEILTEKIRDIR